MLKTNDLRFSYNGIEVLNGINLEVRKGEVVVISGPNGAGKSTLLKLLAGALRGRGKIIMCNEVVQDERKFLPPEKRCSAYLPQGVGPLPHKTVLENLKFAKVNLEEGIEALRYFGLKELDKRAVRLSGGQRRKLAIVMAVLSPKPLLLMDEPLSSLDEGSRRDVAFWIAERVKAKGKGAVWVSHLREALEGSDKAFELKGGTLKGL